MSFKKIVISLLLGITIVFAAMNTSEAYVKEGWKLASKSTTFKWGDRLINVNDTYTKAWESARTSWNVSSLFIFSRNTSSVNTLNTWWESSSNNYGRALIAHDTNTKIVVQFSADLNSGNSNMYKSNVAKSTGVHELGHIIGLAHHDGVTIMNQNRDRTIIYEPQTDDRNGVNAIY